MVSGYLLAAGALMPGAGRLGDLLGRRMVLTVGLMVFGVASLVCALAPSLPVLVAARVAQGAGGAFTMPVGLALLANAYPPGARGRALALGWALGAGGVATACGPFAGGVLTGALSWRAVFWVKVPAALTAAVWAARAADSRDTTAPRSTAPRSVDGKGLVTLTAAVAGLAALLDRGPVWGWCSGRAVLTLVLVTVALLVFVRCERAAAHPLVGPGLFRNRPFVVLTAAGAVANAATVVFVFVVPLALQGPWGLSAAVAGAVFLAPATAMALAGPVAGRIPGAGAVRAMAWCLGLGAAGLCTVPVAPTLPGRIAAATLCGPAGGADRRLRPGPGGRIGGPGAAGLKPPVRWNKKELRCIAHIRLGEPAGPDQTRAPCLLLTARTPPHRIRTPAPPTPTPPGPPGPCSPPMTSVCWWCVSASV